MQYKIGQKYRVYDGDLKLTEFVSCHVNTGNSICGSCQGRLKFQNLDKTQCGWHAVNDDPEIYTPRFPESEKHDKHHS